MNGWTTCEFAADVEWALQKFNDRVSNGRCWRVELVPMDYGFEILSWERA